MSERTKADEAAEMVANIGDDDKPEVRAFLPRRKGKHEVTGKVRIELEFPNPVAMLEWFEEAKGLVLPNDVALYNHDALDTDMSQHNVFIVKREGDRPDHFRLHVTETEERMV